MATTQDEMIAELRRANVELRQEHDLALAREAALADVLDIVGRSPGDPAPVFDAILEKAHSLCDAAMGALVLYDGEFFRAVASHGFPEQHATLICQPYRPNRHHLPLLRGERFIHVPDIRAVGTSDHEVFRNLVQKTDARTLLIVPLRKDGTLLGNITAYRLKVRPYSDKEITLLENFATQAVIAIENARLLGELRQRTADLEESLEYQTATSDVLKVISRSTFDLHPVLSMVAETAARLCAADQAALIRHENGIIEMVANSGFPPEYEARLKKLGPHPLVADAPMVAYRAINERRVVHIHDVAAVPGYAVEPIELGLQRTSLGVPLLRAGEPIGSILLARQRVEPFTDRQIELVSTFADQAVIAIENTRLLTEQREALEQQTATAEVLQVINASPGDLTPVFDAIVEKAHSLCDAAYGSLQLWDGEKFYGVVMRGFAAPMVERLRQGYSPYPNMPCRRLVEGERVAHCADLAEIDDPTARSGVELGGVRTILYVALRKDDALLGQIVAARQEVRPFSKKEISLVESFAAQAVIAMENARLINEQREALEQQTATAEVLQVINASPGDLVPVFDAMLEKAMRLCGGTIGGIFTFDGDHSVTSAIRGVTAAFAQYNDKYPMDEIRPGTVPARIIETRGPVQYADMTAGEPYRAGHPYARALVELGGIRATLAVPFLKDGVAVGMVAIYRQEVGAFSDKQIVLLQNFAGQAVIAMENARLLTEQL
jgi:GAF domain-containing protein